MSAEVADFLKKFDTCSKVDQDSLLFLATSKAPESVSQSRKYMLLNRSMARRCWLRLVGMGSSRADKIGQIDLRYQQPSKKGSQQQASMDSFMIVLYNSVAEHLPDKCLGLVQDKNSCSFKSVKDHRASCPETELPRLASELSVGSKANDYT